MRFNKYVSPNSDLDFAFTKAMLEIISGDIDMMRFLFGNGQ